MSGLFSRVNSRIRKLDFYAGLSQTPLFQGASLNPLSLLCGVHFLFFRKEKEAKDSQAYAA